VNCELRQKSTGCLLRSRCFNISIDCGFELPDQTRKSIDLKSTQLTAAANVGGMNLHQAGGFSGAYSRTRSKTVELADNKVSVICAATSDPLILRQPTPRCQVFYDPGERWNKNGKSYTSYDITTVPGEDPTTGMKHPLNAEFAMGINIDDPEVRAEFLVYPEISTHTPGIRASSNFIRDPEPSYHLDLGCSSKVQSAGVIGTDDGQFII
jgi:hypothetical protein